MAILKVVTSSLIERMNLRSGVYRVEKECGRMTNLIVSELLHGIFPHALKGRGRDSEGAPPQWNLEMFVLPCLVLLLLSTLSQAKVEK